MNNTHFKWRTKFNLQKTNGSYIETATTIQHRRSQGAQRVMPSLKFLAYLVILCFEKLHPKQKYCFLPKVKDFGRPKIWSPKTFWAGCATAINRMLQQLLELDLKYEMLTTETENSFKTQALSVSTSCYWKTIPHITEAQWPLLRFHRTNSDEIWVLKPRSKLWFPLATDLTFKKYCMWALRRHYISSFNRKCKLA